MLTSDITATQASTSTGPNQLFWDMVQMGQHLEWIWTSRVGEHLSEEEASSKLKEAVERINRLYAEGVQNKS